MTKVKYPPEVQKKLKRILKPVLSVLGLWQYKPCALCGTETSWTVNGRPVCPKCSVKYSFIKADRIPDVCEVCGAQGEWSCGKDNQHSLCCRHRDDWHCWNEARNFLLKDYANLPEDEKDVVWERCFNTFIQEAKQRSEAGTLERR
ncbi:unnamed protein product [marine sediment metagenome]|uniref:Uncharacterized protein n=1 Tax=marine sediment metagenome TaxID=412755 RepID=X1J9P7_9ZZZZ